MNYELVSLLPILSTKELQNLFNIRTGKITQLRRALYPTHGVGRRSISFEKKRWKGRRYWRVYEDNKWQYEHRVLWEKHFGKIPAKHNIHHKNHDTWDNSLDNLELVSAKEHAKMHCEERRTEDGRFGKIIEG